MKVNLYAPYRHDPLSAIRLLADEEEDRERLAQARNAFYSKRPPSRLITPRRVAIIIAVSILSFLFLNAWPAKADTLTANQIAQQLKSGSALSLRQNVAGFWADNLLAAQDPSVCSYCASEADSLALSIAAVLKAIRIEADPIFGAGLTFCNLTNCTIANGQSMIAIDDGSGIGITPAFIHFGEVAVSTPEPTSVVTLAACIALYLFALCLPKRSRRP